MSSPPEDDIRRTLARYSMLLDDGRFDDFGHLFTETAQLHVQGRTIDGRDAIRDLMAQSMPPEARGKHMASNSLIEVDGWGGTASAWSDYVFIDPSGTITHQGRYHDKLEREGDKVWRFRLREIVARGDQPEIAQPLPG